MAVATTVRLAGDDGGHEVGERLARAGAGLDDEVASLLDRGGDRGGHLALAVGTLSPAGSSAVTRSSALRVRRTVGSVGSAGAAASGSGTREGTGRRDGPGSALPEPSASTVARGHPSSSSTTADLVDPAACRAAGRCSNVITIPWLYHGSGAHSLEQKVESVHRFAEEVIAPLSD